MYILAFFTNNDVPASGISPLPTIRIRDLSDNSIVVSDSYMQEVGDGFYSYNFSAYSFENDYVFRCDGGSTLDNSERYSYGSTGEYNDDISYIKSTVSGTDVRTELIRKIQTNKLELSDGNVNNWKLYDDDDTTVLLTFSVSDKDGNSIAQPSYAPSKRSKGV